MNFLGSVAGILEAELTSADLGKTLAIAAKQNILMKTIWESGPLSVRFFVSRREYRRLDAICRRRGDQLRILSRPGLYWKARAFLHRPVLAAGLLILLGFFMFLPTRILFITVQGNRQVPALKILEAAQISGLGFGTCRREIRSDHIKNQLLQKLPELSWAGVNTRGCTAEILVEEREALLPGEKEQPSSIVAASDGVIDSCTATRGTLLCAPGQAVTEGQLLISGYVDTGSLIRAVPAEGEVYGRTHRSISVICPALKTVRRGKIRVKRQYSLVIGKKRIKFPGNSGILDGSCGRMYEEYYVTLPGSYRLPVALAVDHYTVRDTADSCRWEPEARDLLETGAASYLHSQMIAGTILGSSGQIIRHPGVYELTGRYFCREMIGRSRQEKIGESYGEKH